MSDEGRSPTIPQQVETWLDAIEAVCVIGAGPSEPKGGQQVGPRKYVMNPSTAQEIRRYLRQLREDLARLRDDQADWRKGVALIASYLGDPADNLSCVRIAELALQIRAQLEEADAERTRLQQENQQLERSNQKWLIDYGMLAKSKEAEVARLTARNDQLRSALTKWKLIPRPWIDKAIGREATLIFAEWDAAIQAIEEALL